MEKVFDYMDELGPAKIVHVYEPALNLRGILVVDNTAAGPAIGGMRMAPDVSLDECFRLARAMTLKNAAAGLAHGGGKSVIYGDPRAPMKEKEPLIRAMARALGEIKSYTPGPDMGTNETCMAWIHDEIGRACALPREVGGIPLDEIGATGYGVFQAAKTAFEMQGRSLSKARVVIQGFGSVGQHAARFFHEEGAQILAVSDSRGAVKKEGGIHAPTLISHKLSGKPVSEYHAGVAMEQDELLGLECEIWIPAARPDVITEANMGQLKTQFIIPGANIAVTSQAEKYLHEKGVLCLPDFIVNAGGVICAALEYQKVPESQVFDVIRERITRNTKTVIEDSEREKVLPRKAAENLAVKRVRLAMETRRHSIY